MDLMEQFSIGLAISGTCAINQTRYLVSTRLFSKFFFLLSILIDDRFWGNESFSSNNVWVDSVGYLHLKLSYDSTNNQWWCAELSSQTNFSFGVLLFYVDGQIDQLDPNVIFSIFTYNEVTVRPEIVMEFSTFDQQDSGTPNLWYQVFPDNVNMDTVTAYGQITLNGTYTTQRMDWKTDSLILQSQYNFTQNPNSQVFCQFILDTSRLLSVPQQASPVHLSVWLDGNAPTDGQEVEIIVQNFFYTSYWSFIFCCSWIFFIIISVWKAKVSLHSLPIEPISNHIFKQE